MEPLLVVAVSLILLWVLFIHPQQRRVREHQELVASLAVGDEVVLTAGIFGRVTTLGDDELTLEVAPGIELRVARQAVLRRAGGDEDASSDAEGTRPPISRARRAGAAQAPSGDVAPAESVGVQELGDKATDDAVALDGGAPEGNGSPSPERGGPR